MPSGPIATCQARLQGDLEEVVAALEFATSAFKTYASSGPILASVSHQADLRAVVEEFRSSTRLTDLNFLFQSLFVQAWSAFELFIRILIVSYLEEISDHASDFDSLNKLKLIERNLYHSGVALQQVFDNRTNVTIDFFATAENAGTSIPASKKVKLNARAFGFFLKGPSIQGIEEALKRIGFAKFEWDKVGSVKEVRDALHTKKTRDTVKQLADYLQSAEKTRNNIVHRGENVQPVAESDIRLEVAVFKAVGDAIAEILRKSIK